MNDNLDLQVEDPTDLSIIDILDKSSQLIAVSRIFARAKKEMSLAEQKTFAFALSKIRFTEEAKTNIIYLDKKELAEIIGIHSDTDHLSVDLFDNIKDLAKHSQIIIADRDLDFYDSGMIITRITMLKKRVKIKFEESYLPLFTGLNTNYITLWSSDIFQMNSKRSVQFYEFLRSITDTRNKINNVALGVKALKEMFEIPKEGKGSYMRKKGGFDRANFEKKVIEPLCEDLKNCKMINLIVQPDGKLYEKQKRGNRVEGYRFYWTFSARPAVATAKKLMEIQERVDKNPVILKIAKDIVNGEKKPKKKDNSFNNFPQRNYDYGELEKKLRKN